MVAFFDLGNRRGVWGVMGARGCKGCKGCKGCYFTVSVVVDMIRMFLKLS